MSAFKGTPGPWKSGEIEGYVMVHGGNGVGLFFEDVSHPGATEDARLIAAAPELLEALHEGRRAIGDHYAPNDCYATGPLTGDAIRDLVECPACTFIAKYDAAIAKATGGTA